MSARDWFTAELWNELCPVGTPVRYWPILPPVSCAPPLDTTTRSEAWTLADGQPCVLISGVSGCVLLSHLRVRVGGVS